MPLTLYKHQQEILDRNPARHLIAFDRGTGKTLTGLLLAGKNNTATGTDITYIIVPKKVKSKWQDDTGNFKDDINTLLGCNLVAENVIIMTKEEFKRDCKTLPKPKAVIVDECFPAGTGVLTPNGYVNIEEIKVGDKVISAVGEDVVYHVGNRITDELCQIKINGQIITTTPDHRFLVSERGWVRAQNLQLNDELLHYSCVHDIIDYYEKPMYSVSESSPSWIKGKKAKFLYKELYNETSLEYKKGGNGQKTKNVLCEESGEGKEFVETNDKEESNEEFGFQAENDIYTKKTRTQAQNSWREWTNDACSAKGVVGRAWCWLVCRARCGDTVQRKTKSLQNRHSEPTNYGSGGNRRLESRGDISPEAGQEKRGCLKIFRVEGVSLQKQGGTRVFNLGVTGHPSYVVKDVLVHNCHYFAGLKSQLSKSLQWFVRYHKVPYIWLMTATPYLSTPWNIYTLGRCLGHDLQYQAWLRSFFIPKYLGMKVIHVPDESKSAELQEYVRSIGTVVGMEEVVDEVPEQEDKFIHVALSPEQKEALQNVDMTNALTGFGQKHQIENGVRKGNEYEPDALIPDYKSIFLLDFKRNYPKMAVFARYTLQVEKYAKMFEEAGYETLILSGKTKDAGEVIKRAVEAENVAIVIQAQCSEGYELPNFDLCVFASLSFSYKDYTQARGRFLRINKLKANTYMHLLTENVHNGKNKSVDMAVWNAIVKKQDFDMGLYMRNEN